MKCPTCGEEMNPGHIKSRRQMFWTDEKRKSIISSNKLEWSWCTIKAYKCDNCSVIVIKDEKEI